MQYLCKKNIEMDKIIGLGNALVDVLATLKDDTLLDEMGLPKGSMQLIDDIKLQQINEKFANMKTHLQPADQQEIPFSDSLVSEQQPVLLEKWEMMIMGNFSAKICKKTILKIKFSSLICLRG